MVCLPASSWSSIASILHYPFPSLHLSLLSFFDLSSFHPRSNLSLYFHVSVLNPFRCACRIPCLAFPFPNSFYFVCFLLSVNRELTIARSVTGCLRTGFRSVSLRPPPDESFQHRSACAKKTGWALALHVRQENNRVVRLFPRCVEVR